MAHSPARSQAVVCFDPLEEGYEWMLFVQTEPASREPIESRPLGGGCFSAPLYDTDGGRSSITVTEILGVSLEMNPDGIPLEGSPSSPIPTQPKTIQGPWKFDFAVPTAD